MRAILRTVPLVRLHVLLQTTNQNEASITDHVANPCDILTEAAKCEHLFSVHASGEMLHAFL